MATVLQRLKWKTGVIVRVGQELRQTAWTCICYEVNLSQSSRMKLFEALMKNSQAIE